MLFLILITVTPSIVIFLGFGLWIKKLYANLEEWTKKNEDLKKENLKRQELEEKLATSSSELMTHDFPKPGTEDEYYIANETDAEEFFISYMEMLNRELVEIKKSRERRASFTAAEGAPSK